MAFARVVRFTDATEDSVNKIVERINENDGPPEGVDSTGMKLIFDKDQGTAIFVGFFETEEKMKAADKILDAMDAGETPGSRASVDNGEIKVEADA